MKKLIVPITNLKDITEDIMQIMTLNAIISTSREETTTVDVIEGFRKKKNIFALELLYQIQSE